jgi:hypothetical protein
LIALVWMRLTAFVRTGRALAPLIAGLVVLSVLYGGGQAQAAEAYGVSAVVLFPVLAWQTKILLDAEPDVQRRLALVAVGARRRELAAGLIAAALVGLVTVLLAMVLPWLFAGITGPRKPGDLPLGEGIAIGIWAHLIAVPTAVALGALASRAVTRSPGRGIAVLVSGAVFTIVLGLKISPAPWLVPPVMATARSASAGLDAARLALLTVQALVWAAVASAGYALLRRTRT